MSDSIEIDGVYNINTGRDKITITPDLARQIVALGHMAQTESMIQQYQIPGMPPVMIAIDARLKAPLNAMENVPAEPFLGEAHQADLEKAHTGDDAAIARLYDVTMAFEQWNDDEARKHAKDLAKAILAAIRAGKVSGVWCDDYYLTLKLSAQELEIAALRVRVAELEKIHDTYCVWQREREKLLADLTAERDRALTDLAAEREHVCALVATSVEQETRIAVERERREKAEAQAAAACNVMVAGGIAIEPKVIAECMKDRDAARAEVAARESQLQGVANARREDQERIVRLVGEVAALKARKVKLPPAFEISVYRDGKFIKAMEADRVIDAIRAAGVDVES